MPMRDEFEQDEGLTACPRCGADAEWRSLDVTGERVEVACPECGRFQALREEMESAELEPADDGR